VYTDMEMWRDIRYRFKVRGESKRSLMQEYGIHYRTLQKILENPEPPGYQMTKLRNRPVIGPYVEVILSILKADTQAPKKQRHTAQRLFDRLRDEYGYPGSYRSVCVAVQEIQQKSREVFVPLAHQPGTAQVDYGFAEVEFASGRQQVALFVMTLPCSDAIFVCASPRECTETFQQGHVWAFEYFGGVPNRISYDNSKIAVITVGKGRDRILTTEFLRLQSHHLFKEHFCLVGRPQEKGHVETHVGYVRRNYLVPVPHFDDYQALNDYLLECCRKDLARSIRGKDGSKSERLVIDQQNMLPLPKQRFEARRIENAGVNSYSLVRFDRNDYSVPTKYAHRKVTAIGGIDTVKLVIDNKLVATHPRSWGKEATFFDAIHYLGLLERKPGAFDFAKPLQQWQLPESFDILRRRLENQSLGIREYIKVLRLLEKCNIKQLCKAIEYALEIGAIDSEAIRLILETQQQPTVTTFCLDGRPHLQTVHVAGVDLTAYQSLSAGDVR